MLKNKVLNITEKIKEMKASIIEEINKFEQNPKIKPLSKTCFVINRNDLSEDLNLSPFYYNHKLQYEYISNVINKSRVEDILNVLMNIIETKQHKKDNFHRVRFAPEVINKLKTLI